LQTNLYAFSPPSKKINRNQVQVGGGQGAFPLPAPWPAYPHRRNGIHKLYFAFQAVNVKEKNKNFAFRPRRPGEIPDRRTHGTYYTCHSPITPHILFVIGRFFFFRLFFMLSGDYSLELDRTGRP
jgi:hypothetical protein